MIQDFSISVKAAWRDALTIAQKTGGAAAAGLFGSRDCLLCLDNAGMRTLCHACEGLVPRAGAACPGCARPQPGTAPCGRCLRRVAPLDGLVAAFAYRFPLDRLVQRFKYGGDLPVGEYLGGVLSGAVAERPRPDVIVPSPASRARLKERGFNPAAVLAKRVSDDLRVPWHPALLRKVRHTPPQAGLARTARARNVRGAFGCEPVPGLRVAVVDDVVTTGATLEAIARALKSAGAAQVEGWVVARTPPPGREG